MVDLDYVFIPGLFEAGRHQINKGHLRNVTCISFRRTLFLQEDYDKGSRLKHGQSRRQEMSQVCEKHVKPHMSPPLR